MADAQEAPYDEVAEEDYEEMDDGEPGEVNVSSRGP